VLVAPADAAALADAIAAALGHGELTRDRSRRLQQRVQTGFSVESMTEQVLAGYAEAMAPR
jgi:glycosyltransferase involved in cell wall biosynthesis